MELKSAGLALFLLVYVYIWLKNYNDIRDTIESTIDTITPIGLLVKLIRCNGEVLTYMFVILLIFATLILSVFRALAGSSLGDNFDMFPIRMTFGFMDNKSTWYAAISGALLGIFIILLMVPIYRIAIKKTKNAKFVWTWKTFWIKVKWATRYVFIPDVPQDTAMNDLVAASTVVNLLSLVGTVVLMYSGLVL